MTNPTTAAARYTSLARPREAFLRRARAASRLTIPALVPPIGHGSENVLPTPHQGLGAQGVNNLASKLLLSLFPPTTPFFRLRTNDPFALEQLGSKIQTEVEETLVRIERLVHAEVDVMALRVKLFEALKHLLVAGNAAIELSPDGTSRVYGLDQYVALRSPHGGLDLLIIREVLSADNLPQVIEDMVASTQALHQPDTTGQSAVERGVSGLNRQLVDVFTTVEWDDAAEAYRIHQELADGRRIPETAGKYPKDKLPFMVLRYAPIDGEDYGRGMVEEVLGDLVTLEGLMRAIIEASAASSRMLFLVDPAGAAVAEDLDQAPNGAFRMGRASDVSALQVNKHADLQVAFTTAQRVETRLMRAFLLNTAVQREAERVTAEEIRFVAQELESTLGGVFSVLSQELQLPLVTQIMDRMTREKRIPKLSTKTVRPTVVTGIEALGRGQELQKIAVFAASAQQIVGPEGLAQYVNARALLGQLAAAAGLDTSELIKSQEEVDAERQQAQRMAMLQQFGPDAIKAFGPALSERMGLGVQPEEPEPPPATPAQ